MPAVGQIPKIRIKVRYLWKRQENEQTSEHGK